MVEVLARKGTSVLADVPPAEKAAASPMEGSGDALTAADAVRGHRERTRRKVWIIVGLGALALAAFVAAIVTGPMALSPREFLVGLVHPGAVSATTHTVLWDLRLPTAVMALLVGASLSLSGAHMQTILDNPLAEPFTLGVSAAAAFGAAASIVLGIVLIPHAQFNLAATAGITALAAVAVIALVSLRTAAGKETIVLLGIALVFMFHALLALLQYAATTEALQQIVFWTMGSLQRATWTSNAVLLGVLAVAIPFTWLNSWRLTALRLGEDRAAALGINVNRLRVSTLVVASLLAAVAVAFAGVIGFVGLVGPHVARLLVGEDQRYFAPAAVAAGAAMLTISHALSITVIPGVAIPIGIITSLAGVPFFVAIIVWKKRGPRAISGKAGA